MYGSDVHVAGNFIEKRFSLFDLFDQRIHCFSLLIAFFVQSDEILDHVPQEQVVINGPGHG